ncbi:hypothetical protein L2089_20055 [Paenibacillus hunanensis]|uniref:hypothetical protein n=1 Tax=Paenibacillus hunanensis TaxID=539262 RepID=UPI002027606E|nr:hypothetical protein [Paenibacillus hunanensis]MCL9662989.1 hypothetical protein [Paenibacillus hunanensis]
MIKLMLGCTSILSSMMLLCTGFILAGFQGLSISSQVNGGAFSYNILNDSLIWLVSFLIFLIVGLVLIYSSRREFN